MQNTIKKSHKLDVVINSTIKKSASPLMTSEELFNWLTYPFKLGPFRIDTLLIAFPSSQLFGEKKKKNPWWVLLETY